MKSSKTNKTNIDEISRETQRLVSESHVRLPYHKAKQKSLKDFLNRSKIPSEYQVSLTGSKVHLKKAWEFIESKERGVEKFYNEDNNEKENVDEILLSDTDEKTLSLDTDDENNQNEELLNKENNEIMFSKIGGDDDDDDEKNHKQNSIVGSVLSTKSIVSSSFDNDVGDKNKNSNLTSSSCAEKPTSQFTTQHSFLKNSDNSNDSEEHTDSQSTVDNNDESTENMTTQEVDDSSDDEENISKSIDESDEEDFSIKRKSKLIVLSESSDDDDESVEEMKLTCNDLINPLFNESQSKLSTQQLMDFCSGEFKTQQSEDNNQDIDDDESVDDMKLTCNDLNPLFNKSQSKLSTQQLMDFCSGEFKTQQSEDNNQDNDDNFDDFDSEVPLNDLDNNTQQDNIQIKDLCKLMSIKDYFDDEAELSESDWSSDDEENLVNISDELEEEEGDKDNIDNNIVKDGLDKMFRRQLFDDDQKQVNMLKEMLLEDGDLHTDSGRKRKFQWDEADEKDLKKPLFSDDEDDNEDGDISDSGSINGQWRKERFKRDSYLFNRNNFEQQFDEDSNSNSVLQPSISVINKTHVVKYQKEEKKNILNETEFNKDKNSSTVITNTIDTVEITKINSNSSTDIQTTGLITPKLSKTLKGSFMKCTNRNKMATTLLYMNKNSIIANESNRKKYDRKIQTNSIAVTATATSNDLFPYLLKNDKKQEVTNVRSIDFKNANKIDRCARLGNSSASAAQPIQQVHKIKSRSSSNSVLKQLE